MFQHRAQGSNTLRIPVVLATLAFAFACAAVNAAEWSQQIVVPVSVEYDTNPAMRADTEGGVWRARLVPSYSTALRTNVDELNASIGLVAERPSDDTFSKRRDDKSASAGWKRNFETSSLQANISTTESSTRTTELDEAGQVALDSTRKQTVISVAATRALTGKTSFNLSGSNTRTSYDTDQLISFDNLTAQVGVSHQYTDQTGLFAQVSQTRFDPQTGLDTRTDVLTAGATFQQTERFKWSGQLGARQSSGAASGNGIDGNISVNWGREFDEFSAMLARAQADSSTGAPVVTDKAALSWRRAHGENQSSGIDGSISSVRDASGALIAQAAAWHGREIDSSLHLRLFVQHKKISQNGFDAARATIAGVTLGYTWQRTR